MKNHRLLLSFILAIMVVGSYASFEKSFLVKEDISPEII